MKQEIVDDWSDLLERQDVLILDTETTGIDGSAEIVQISIIDTMGNELLDEYVMPKGSIPPEASKVHGLTRQRLVSLGAHPWKAHHSRCLDIIGRAAMVLVYNLQYDARIIRQTNRIHGLPHKDFPGRCIMLDYAEYRGIQGYRGGWKWHKLEAAARYERASRVQESVHSSLADCHVVLEVMKAVCNR